jgi:protein LSM14
MPPYGAPPGWGYPPPGGQGFPQPGPGPFPYGQFPPGPPGQQPPQGQKPAPIGPGANKQLGPGEQAAVEDDQTTAPAAKAPSPAADEKSEESKASSAPQPAVPVANKPAVAKNGRVMPVVPLASPAGKVPVTAHAGNAAKPAVPQQNIPTSNPALDEATKAATAAVAAAMAKLPNVAQPNGGVDNLTRKVNEIRVNDPIRAPRHPSAGTTGFAAGQRGRGRGGARPEGRKVEVPSTDFDFESANAKFNKQDLVKEAIAGSPLGEVPADEGADVRKEDVVIPAGSGYNKSSSFFDNISSESRDRQEAEANGTRPGGREWRGEEQKKNVETFGQGSVDNGYRGGFRGRGRGRGGMRGRGYGANGQQGMRGRGGYRGGRTDGQPIPQ